MNRQELMKWVDNLDDPDTPKSVLMTIAGSAVYGEELTETIVRRLAKPEVETPSPMPAPVVPFEARDLLHDLHQLQLLLLAGDPDYAQQAGEFHDRIGLLLQSWDQLRTGPLPMNTRPPAERPAVVPEPALEPPPATPADDPFADLFSEPVRESEPDNGVVHEDDLFRVTAGRILHAIDKTTGEAHVYAEGTALCLIHGPKCAFAVAHLGGS